MTGDLLVKPSTNSTTAFQVQQSDGTDVLEIDTINRKLKVTSATTGQSTIDAGLIVNNSAGGDTIDDFSVKTTSNYNAINVDASNDDITIMSNASGKVGFFGATPSVQDTGWSVTNETTDRVYDTDSTTVNELADVLGTLIEELKSKGLIGG